MVIDRGFARFLTLISIAVAGCGVVSVRALADPAFDPTGSDVMSGCYEEADVLKLSAAVKDLAPSMRAIASSNELASYKTDDELESFFALEWHENYLAHPPGHQKSYETLVNAAADQFHFPHAYLACLADAESHYQPRATSGVGAKGIIQIMPTTAIGIQNALLAGKEAVDPAPDQIPRNPALNSAAQSVYIDWKSDPAMPAPLTYGGGACRDREPSCVAGASAELKDPELELKLAAAYLKIMAIDLFGGAAMDENHPLSPDQLSILTAAYNLGEGGLRNFCNLTQAAIIDGEESVKSCVSKLDPYHYRRRVEGQTWEEMKQVSICMSPLYLHVEPTSRR